MLRIGIDLGGTKIEGIALDGSREVARLRVDTPRDDYAGDARRDRRRSSATLEARGRRAAATVGVGIPGHARRPRPASSRTPTPSG